MTTPAEQLSSADGSGFSPVTTVDPDSLVDPRVRALLERYVALAGAEFLCVAPECFELSVPREDRPAFGGRAVVRVALSLGALESDPDAEMAVVGSAFVEQLIAAVRRRGARLVHGDVVASVPSGESFARLDTPVVNGTAGLPSTSIARHAVGRLVARVAVRAGTGAQEYLVESGLFDLTTGLPLGQDIADACTTTVTSGGGGDRSVDPPASGHAPARSMDELLPMMLGDLERRLAPEITRQRLEAERALQVELARIDRYYTRMLQDLGGRGTEIPDASARRAIEAEHARRRGEEMRRHEVRATVHPVQLAEWTVPVERAEWPLESADGHRSSLVGQRVLVGSGSWAVGCPHCGRTSPDGVVVCRHDHTACAVCSHLCGVCGTGFCDDHGIKACHVDGQPTCDEHARTCLSCRNGYCSAHELVCEDGGHAACSTCVAACEHCGRAVCEEHAIDTSAGAPLGRRRLCAECVRYCEGGTNEPVGVDEVVRCASCERFVCHNHQATCAVDGKVHCSTHLRRTDRSRRLVCEHDRAACAYEPHAVLAADEVVACASCGAIACSSHTGACFVDGQRHCTSHLVPLQDLGGGRLGCAAHHSVCHVDRKTFSLEGTQDCPACGRRTCSTHTRTCPNCARAVCVPDFVVGPKGTCTTCNSLAAVADPSDSIIQAALVARGNGASPKSWRQARDATHTVVELDLGWTRRVVFTVHHDDSVPATVVRHSMLGSAVARKS